MLILLMALGLAQAQSEFFLLARTGTADEVRNAIEAGADVNVADQHGHTPIIYALYNLNSEVITVLLEAGADVNALTNALWTPLMYAARDAAHPEVILRLLEHNPVVSTRNPQGLSALNYASRNPALRGAPVLMDLLNLYWAEDAAAIAARLR